MNVVCDTNRTSAAFRARQHGERFARLAGALWDILERLGPGREHAVKARDLLYHLAREVGDPADVGHDARLIRRLVRALNVVYGKPVVSDSCGSWVAQSAGEVREYRERAIHGRLVKLAIREAALRKIEARFADGEQYELEFDDVVRELDDLKRDVYHELDTGFLSVVEGDE